MLKRSILLLLIAAAFLFAGCPVSLTSSLPADLVIMLGRFNPAGGITQLRGALGGTIEVPVLIVDQTGGEADGNYTVTFTLSVDADLSTTGDNIAAGEQSVPAGTETVVEITVPDTAAAVVYTLFGVLTATDAATNNNKSSIQVDIGADNLPDLEIAVGDTPAWADPGTSMTIGYRVYNTGYKKVAAGELFKVQFTVNLSGTDEIMGEETITLAEDLYPQDFITRQLAVTLPTLAQIAADAGLTEAEVDEFNTVYTVTVDVDNDVAEIAANEGGTDTFTVVSGNRKPDFVMNDIIMPDGFSAARAGSPAHITLEIINSGRSTSGDYGVDLYIDFDQDDTFDTGTDVYLHRWAAEDTPAVPYDTTSNGNNIVYLNTRDLSSVPVYPADTTPGTYDIRAEIVTEADEYATGNNDATEVDVDFVEALYNLSMKFMSTTLASAIAEADGGTIPLSFVLENDGEDDVETDFDVTFYAGADETLETAGDIDLGTHTVTATVPAGGTLSQTFEATFPGGEGAGFYTLYWIIDSGAAVDETDEGDNRPTTAEYCFVFPLVSDGTSSFQARLLAYKPYGTQSAWRGAEIRLYGTLWMMPGSGNGYAVEPGEQYTSTNQTTLTFGDKVGVQIEEYWYEDSTVAFRVVPGYVASVPASIIPYSRSVQDRYEPNNSQDKAYALPEDNNPLYGFVTCWIDRADDQNDYFTFDIP